MKVLVTGGGGFIGRYVVETLLEEGAIPIVFDRHNKGDLAEGAEFFLGDIANSEDVTEAIAHADGWIHLAGVLGTAETISNPRPATHTNLMGGLNVLEAAAQYKVPGVNIAVGNHWMNNTYAITKSTMERFVRMFNAERGTQISIVRALNAYGPRQISAAPYGPSKVKKITPAFVNAAIRGLPIEIYGDGSQIMDMIYVGDVAKVLVQALGYTMVKGAHSGIFEAGTGRDTTVNDIAEIVNRVAGNEAGIVHVPMRAGEPDHSVVIGDPATLRPLNINDDDLVPLEEGIEETVKWYRQNS
jgi:UDP-glucose 4-epimerase